MSKRRRRLPWGVRIYWVLARRISRQRRSSAELHRAIQKRNEALKTRTGQYVWAVRQLRWANKRLWKEAAAHQATREEAERLRHDFAAFAQYVDANGGLDPVMKQHLTEVGAR